ncbi:SapB/AmfS family lanthipeptide [Streptomyces sp. NPDC049837]
MTLLDLQGLDMPDSELGNGGSGSNSSFICVRVRIKLGKKKLLRVNVL